MNVAQPSRPRARPQTIPRDYNFAADILKRNLEAGRAGKLAYIDRRQGWTYGDLATRVERFGHVLRSLGVRREERDPDLFARRHRLADRVSRRDQSRHRAVPVNTLLTADDYRFMLDDSRARLLVVSEELFPKFADADRAERGPRPRHRVRRERIRSSAVRGHARRRQSRAGNRADGTRRICFWLYTSGSTGRPKAAVHTHADLKFTDELYGKPFLGISESDVCYSVAKLFFAYGLGNALTFPMSAGATTVLLPDRPTPEAVAEILKKHQVTVFYAVPTFYAGFLASPAAPERRR